VPCVLDVYALAKASVYDALGWECVDYSSQSMVCRAFRRLVRNSLW